ncbi:MAG: hypothetical protein M3040_17770 [Bacteroidota bacterium]|nr:hypothetical protein [Bacteroidota bacterium]
MNKSQITNVTLELLLIVNYRGVLARRPLLLQILLLAEAVVSYGCRQMS